MENQAPEKQQAQPTSAGQTLYLVLGFSCVGLAALGAALPLLPTTPFVLLAAGCFARSSKRWHDWLAGTRLFGPLLKKWQRNRCIDKHVKRIAIGSILIFGTSSLFIMSSNTLRLIGLMLLLIGFIVVLRLKTCADCEL
ncbi:YbaN family protein [Simiduia curdlanivorans]|uniref:Inner membrane protein n=1 Tax=Simiduia curdlanivorans TaxID=1492769 RepID=A0ABV8V0E7_9GAMM|nr:YbaN family protein [Simiduia curdlanivorans]MDN3637767.1 YbaN family protein [Simiduia curdlanivorans]